MRLMRCCGQNEKHLEKRLGVIGWLFMELGIKIIVRIYIPPASVRSYLIDDIDIKTGR
jgi:hypothetical protein